MYRPRSPASPSTGERASAGPPPRRSASWAVGPAVRAADPGPAGDAAIGPPCTPNVPAYWRGVGGRTQGAVVAAAGGRGAREAPRLAGDRWGAPRPGVWLAGGAGGLGRREPWRGDDRGRRIGRDGLSLTPHPARTVGVPAVVPRGDVTLVRNVHQDPGQRTRAGPRVRRPPSGPQPCRSGR